MAHTFLDSVRFPPVTSTTLTDTTISGSFNPGAGATVVVAAIMYIGTTARGGGAPTFNGTNMTQADSRRSGLTSGECSVELWYMVSPPNSGSYTISVPNSGGLATNVDVASAKAATSYTSVLDVASGSANSGATTNPYTTLTTSGSGDIIFAGVANGAQNWGPSAQTGTNLFTRDNGAWGESSQYYVQTNAGAQTMSWTFGTGEDWGVVAVAFKEQYQPQTHDGAASLSGQSELTPAAKIIINGASNLSGASEILVIASKIISFASNLTATSEILAEGARMKEGVSTLSGLSEITSIGKKTIGGTSDLAATTEIVVLSKTIIGGYCGIAVITSLTTNGSKYLNGATTLLSNSEIIPQGVLYLNGTSTLLSTSLLIAIATSGVLLVRTSGVYSGINRFTNNVGRIN